MSQQLKNKRQRYVDAEDFIKFGQSLKVTISNRLLEEMEKEKLLFPTYRTICPREYIEVSWKRQEIDVDLWKEIDVFDREMEIQQIPSEQANEKLLKEGHPLDIAWESQKSYIQKPERESFRPWKDYEVTVEYPDGTKTTRESASAFYEQWQIYHIDEITSHVLGQRRWALLRGYLNLPPLEMPKSKSSVMQYQDMHRILADYQFRCQLHFEKAFLKAERQGSRFIEGENHREYKNNIHKESIEAFKQASEDRWIEFSRDLCRFCFRYQEREKESLKSVARLDLRDACQVVIDALGLDYMALAERVGRHIDGRTFIGKFALEHIFPDPQVELIRKGSDSLSSFMDDYTKATDKPKESLEPDLPEKLVRSSIDEGNEALIIKMIEINDERFSPALHHEERLWAFLRTLSVAVEVFGKSLGYGDKIDSILKKTMNGKFEPSFRIPLDRKWRNSGQQSSIDRASKPGELIKRIDFIRANASPGVQQYLITTKLLRDYLSHNTAIDVDLLGERFIFLYKSLVLTAMYLFDNRGKASKKIPNQK